MWRLGSVLCVMVAALPQGASAQAKEDTNRALKLEQYTAGVEVEPSPPRTGDGFTLEEMQLRVQRARNGLVGSSVLFGVGAVLMIAGGATMASASIGSDPWSDLDRGVAGASVALAGGFVGFGGVLGMAISGGRWRARKRQVRELKRAHDNATPHRVQWDLARSRFVF